MVLPRSLAPLLAIATIHTPSPPSGERSIPVAAAPTITRLPLRSYSSLRVSIPKKRQLHHQGSCSANHHASADRRAIDGSCCCPLCAHRHRAHRRRRPACPATTIRTPFARRALLSQYCTPIAAAHAPHTARSEQPGLSTLIETTPRPFHTTGGMKHPCRAPTGVIMTIEPFETAGRWKNQLEGRRRGRDGGCCTPKSLPS